MHTEQKYFKNTTLRERISIFVILVSVTAILYRGFSDPLPQKYASLLTASTEKTMLNWQVQVGVGFGKLLEKYGGKSSDDGSSSSLVEESIITPLLKSFDSNQFGSSYERPAENYLMQAIAAGHFGDSAYKRYLDRAEELGPKSTGTLKMSELIESAYVGSSQSNKEKSFEITDTEIKPLGWLGQLLLHDAQKAQIEVKLNGSKAFSDPFVLATRKALILFCFTLMALIGFAVGACSLIVFLLMLWRGAIHYRLSPPNRNHSLSVEIFAAYLATMSLFMGSSHLFGDLSTVGRLYVSLAVPLVLLGLVFWPRLYGESFKEIRARVGLKLGGVRGVVTDTVLAPFFFVGAWPVFFLIGIVYELIIKVLGLNLAQAQHPAVPAILAADGIYPIILMFFVASVIAPIVEEVMFRGAFYGWLRSKLSMLPSMAISAFIFAAVHPQGALGIPILTCLGMWLAYIREIRGSVLPGIIAHGLLNATVLIFVIQLR